MAAPLVVLGVTPDFDARGGRIDETILRESPIFADLVALWSKAGRTVPGQADREWGHLTAPPAFTHGGSAGRTQRNQPSRERS